jgi:hypothetical protein
VFKCPASQSKNALMLNALVFADEQAFGKQISHIP